MTVHHTIIKFSLALSCDYIILMFANDFVDKYSSSFVTAFSLAMER